jgi:uncharacterized alpha-E superfamily protein
MLLSRVAENVYWAGRYLERAEGTARIVREHTNLMVDLPTTVPVTWEPLIIITGSRDGYFANHDKPDEQSVVRYLVGDHDNPGSILRSLEHAREDLRTTREVLPREVWRSVNDLYLYIASNHNDGVARRSRARFFDRVIGDVLKVTGVVASTMSRDDAYAFLRAGRYLERADVTTRVIEVRAGSILEMERTYGDTYEDIQWMSVLRSISALQMYHLKTRSAVDGPSTLRFLLQDQAFPRSAAFCIAEVRSCISGLPNVEPVLDACNHALRTLHALDVETLTGVDVHEAMDDLQIAIGAVHDAIAAAYFSVPAVAG